MKFKYFSFHDVEEAIEWGTHDVAIHHTGFPYRRWKFTCHMWAPDEDLLREAIKICKADPKWIQKPPVSRHLHFDIFGKPLDIALLRCAQDTDTGPNLEARDG